MTTDDMAEKLGYYDTKHLEDNIANYGEPLDTWWAVIKNTVNNYDIIPRVVKPCDHQWIERHSGHCRDCIKCGRQE